MINIFYTMIGLFNLIFVQIQISAKNPIHRIAAQISIFLTGSFIFIQLDNYFQGLTYIIVYVGAIAILFQFVIMLIEQPSVGSNYEINNNLQNHYSVLTYYIKNKKNFNKGIKKEQSFSYLNNNLKFKKEDISSQNLKDIISYYNNINLNDKNNINKILIIKKISEFKSKEHPPIEVGPQVVALILDYTLNPQETFPDMEILIDQLQSQEDTTPDKGLGCISNASLEIFNYFYPTWAIEFKVITDIETQGVLIYVAYPFAQILVSIALWTVMIGIISICSPRRLLQ